MRHLMPVSLPLIAQQAGHITPQGTYARWRTRFHAIPLTRTIQEETAVKPSPSAPAAPATALRPTSVSLLQAPPAPQDTATTAAQGSVKEVLNALRAGPTTPKPTGAKLLHLGDVQSIIRPT